MKSRSIGLATGVVLLAACTTQNTDLVDKTPIDGGSDVSSEEAFRDGPVADAPTEDGGEDGAVDGGEDGAVDGGEDGAVDGGEDGAVDGGEDGAVDGGEDGGCPPGHRLAWLTPGCQEQPVCSSDYDASACTFCGCDGVTKVDFCIPGFPYKHKGACDDAGDAGPQELPSVREVRFHVANAEAGPRFIGLDGYQCLAWSVERMSPLERLSMWCDT